MPLIKNGRIVEDDWQTVADDAPVPEGVPSIVSAARCGESAAEEMK